jgi:hypothetical protein
MGGLLFFPEPLGGRIALHSFNMSVDTHVMRVVPGVGFSSRCTFDCHSWLMQDRPYHHHRLSQRNPKRPSG